MIASSGVLAKAMKTKAKLMIGIKMTMMVIMIEEEVDLVWGIVLKTEIRIEKIDIMNQIGIRIMILIDIIIENIKEFIIKKGMILEI